MIDDKKRFKFPKSDLSEVGMDILVEDPNTKETSIVKQEIEVKKYLSMTEQDSLIGIYVSELFSDSFSEDKRVSRAENALMASILETCTNIQLVEDDKVVAALDVFFENFEVWEQIVSKVKNYRDFRKRLDATVEMIREEKRIKASLGKVIDETYSKLSGFFEDLINNDFSPEKIEGIKSLLAEVNASPILKESVEIFKSQSKNKTEKAE